MAQGLSERSLSEWSAFAASAGADASKPLDRDLLFRFLIVVHNRGEELSAHELKSLVDELDVAPELGQELISLSDRPWPCCVPTTAPPASMTTATTTFRSAPGCW